LDEYLPHLNATLNAIAALLLTRGWILIRRRDIAAHRRAMLSAYVVSGLFQTTYDVYHAETEASLLTQLCKTPEDEARAIAAAEETLNALYDFLDGVERRYGKAA
jgi:hypothetical protein